ncbi:MAG: hypothetical protein KDI09_20785 [Halioglobus sp.]|nr:hypothetical protein [Halioglobus sp.]
MAFDTRDDAMMLLFARTSARGEIDDYLLLMRRGGEQLHSPVYLEINEKQLSGNNLIREARMSDNMLTLSLHEPAAGLGGEKEIVLIYESSATNKANVETGAFRVLGDCLAGGNA